jgi:hypothetical protein
MNEITQDDPSGVAVGLMLNNYIHEFAATREFTFDDYYTDSNRYASFTSGFTQARLALDESPLGDAINQFKETCRKAITFYKPESKVSDDLINDAINLMIDAKKTFKRYPKFQISKDALASNNEQLKIQEQIYVFETIADLVDQSTLLPNGFSLNLIRTARPTDSFFCIVVKAGGNIYLLTDKPQTSEFERDFMSGRNQRYNLMRYEGSMLPYEFIEMTVSNGGRDITMSDNTDLVVADNGLRVLGHFKEMRNDSLLWFTFMLEECRNEFFSTFNPNVPALGYVDSSTIEHKLLGNTSNDKQLPSTYVSKGTIVQKGTKALDRDNFVSNLPEGAKILVSKNAWMEEKYNDLIDESLLYIPENVSTDTLILENKQTGLISLENKGEQDDSSRMLDLPLKRLPAAMLGTHEEVQAEADLIARFNKSLIIAKLMKEDYEERLEDVKTWIAKKIKKNLPNIVDKLVALDHEHFFIAHRANELAKRGEMPSNYSEMLRQIHVANMPALYDFKSERTILQKVLGIRDTKNNPKCAMTKVRYPTYSFYLNVDCILDLEILTGLSREEFPIELQNWHCRSDLVADLRSYIYDPIEALNNPWWKMDFKFAVCLDKEYVLQRRRELGVKGRFVKPLNYFEETGASMFEWLKNHPKMEGVRVTTRSYRKSDHNRPSWSFYKFG